MNDLLYGELSHVDEHVDHQNKGLHGDVLGNDNDSRNVCENITEKGLLQCNGVEIQKSTLGSREKLYCLITSTLRFKPRHGHLNNISCIKVF